MKGIMLPNPFEEKPKKESWIGIYPATLLIFANDLREELKNPNLNNLLTSETPW